MKFNEFLEKKGIAKDYSEMDASKQAELFNEFNDFKMKEIDEAVKV